MIGCFANVQLVSIQFPVKNISAMAYRSVPTDALKSKFSTRFTSLHLSLEHIVTKHHIVTNMKSIKKEKNTGQKGILE